ncbi:MAG: HupE/UreJ family protein [Cyanobacteriota bacterium]|nr:HupE/UreJ family protein [Cyanobacteriota bacterium]
MTFSAQPRTGFWLWPLTGGTALVLLTLATTPPAQAHHLMDLTQLAPSPLTGFLSGLAHPILGPDHLLFLCAVALVGLRRRAPWLVGLLLAGSLGSVVGLVLPGLPLAEAAVAFSLVVAPLVWMNHWPKTLLLPAIALHGYVLSASVIGWSRGPLAFYGLGLLLSQGLLLLLALTLLRSLADRLSPQRRGLIAAGLIGCGAAWTWSALVA